MARPTSKPANKPPLYPLKVHLLKCAAFPNLCNIKIQAIPLQGKMLTFQFWCLQFLSFSLFINSFNSYKYTMCRAL